MITSREVGVREKRRAFFYNGTQTGSLQKESCGEWYMIKGLM
jgi:hypothetical protein